MHNYCVLLVATFNSDKNFIEPRNEQIEKICSQTKIKVDIHS